MKFEGKAADVAARSRIVMGAKEEIMIELWLIVCCVVGQAEVALTDSQTWLLRAFQVAPE
jgi:hypothetical protein